MQSSPYQPGQPARPGEAGQPGPHGAGRIPGVLVFVLVIVAAHALGTVFGGWAVLDENWNKQEHGQDLLMPMGMAWFVALFCWALAALLVVCVVLARTRRSWVRVVLIVCLSFVACSTAVGFLGSLVAGAPSLAVFVIAGIDAAALWTVCGETGRHYFSVRGPAPTTAHG
ncbi:hypothetical protein [Streptomyces calvus]|uniref:Cation transport ATPase n=1 Tax=Streptomyces calvus TaxID=67282 RepID=A0AA40VH75_9ACTN|nr:hypothetical protein [Streptomyces calvus]MBA8943534.1 cation transport ATPase [Streptomyces calvus]GGP39461.1 hypothetical protein GCM10010247_09620 [Streptomyces calvus]